MSMYRGCTTPIGLDTDRALHKHALPVLDSRSSERFQSAVVIDLRAARLERLTEQIVAQLSRHGGADAAEFIRSRLAKGQMGGLGLRVDDCQKTYDELVAKGVDFVQPPADRPYGVEAVMRDCVGNWLVLVEPKPFNPNDTA